MNNSLHLFVALLAFQAAVCTQAQSGGAPYDAVDTLIGTSGGGNTFPGASLPFGMMQWSPDTGKDAWYFYTDKQIRGFSLTHIGGAGWPPHGNSNSPVKLVEPVCLNVKNF